MNRRDWYERVNAAWPAGPLPKLTTDEAVKAARRLFRFCKLKVREVTATSGNRHNWGRWDGVFVVNPDKGWRELVHGVAHWAHYRLTPGGVAPHDKSHARLELRLVKQVVKRGWLTGRLKPQPKVATATAKPAGDAKLEHARAMLAKADTRLKRATTIRRKWAQRVARLERKVAAPAPMC
jgi:hypothetical protein